VYSAAIQVFAAEFVLSVANKVFSTELCCPQQKCDSLPKSSCLQRISIHYRSVWPAMNQFSLPNYTAYNKSVFTNELCGQQRISFAAEVVLSAANLRS